MTDIKNISIEDFTYDLPDNRIAKFPLDKRDHSKLLIYNESNFSEDRFSNIANHLPKNSLLVSNNTKVIRARIELFKETGARIEVFCLEPYNPSDYNISFAQNQKCQWLCIVGNLKKWKQGELTREINVNGNTTSLKVIRVGLHNESHIVEFSWNNQNLSFSEILESLGNIPIPPYLNRDAEESDLDRYQTVYSKHKGSVAAPTAGLHFTEDVFNSLKNKNINRHEITLHVGAGTFKPVKSENIGDHEMHYEQFIISIDTISLLLQNKGSITAVGTTTVRTLESIYWLGVKLLSNKIYNNAWVLSQWDAYELPSNISVSNSLSTIYDYMINSEVKYINASTGIMIAPGYNFKLVNLLVTNFHQPQSTLLLLISAFMGNQWKKMYSFALENNYRFLSYGDSCLLKP